MTAPGCRSPRAMRERRKPMTEPRRLPLVVQRDNAETDEPRAGNAWRSSGAGSGPAGGCSWAIAGAAVSERRDRRRHARGYVREWTSEVAVSSQIGPSSQIRLARRESVGLDRGPSCSGCGCGGCCIGHRRLQRAGGRLGRQHRSHPVAARWSHGCPAAASHWKDDFARVFGQRKSEVGQRRPRPRVSAGVGAPACSRGCMGRAHRREWGLIVK